MTDNMKLIIGGTTGKVGAETLRQALLSPIITSIIALGRKPSAPSDTSKPSKLQNVVLEDFMHYSSEAKRQLADADAFIW